MKKIFLSILLFASVVSLISCNSHPTVFSFKKVPKEIDSLGFDRMKLRSSDYLPWEDAQKMMEAYEKHPNALQVLNGTTIETLKGLQIDADHLRAMLLDKSITKVEFYFGVNQKELSLPQDEQHFTIITAPIYFDLISKKLKVKKFRDMSKPGGGPENSEIIDFCDPCPKNCPDTN